tara:strand:- start:314 stop:922 length:609 start_codon:yes stop_codon:yes gene_type:complete
MSVIIGTVRNFESKPSQYGDGNFERIQIETDNGYKSWYTSYANRHVDVGEEITAELRESKKTGKEYIASFELRGAEAAQRDRGYDGMPKAQTPARSAPGASQGDSSEERQLSIVTQSLFKTIFPVAAAEMQAEDCLLHCIKLAMKLEKEVKKAVAAKHLNGAKAALNEEQNQQAQQASDDAEGGFIDDDVPFSQLRGDLYAL